MQERTPTRYIQPLFDLRARPASSQSLAGNCRLGVCGVAAHNQPTPQPPAHKPHKHAPLSLFRPSSPGASSYRNSVGLPGNLALGGSSMASIRSVTSG